MKIQPRCGKHDCALVPSGLELVEVRQSVEPDWYEVDLTGWMCPENLKREDEIVDRPDPGDPEYFVQEPREAFNYCASSWDFIVKVHATGNPNHTWEVRGV